MASGQEYWRLQRLRRAEEVSHNDLYEYVTVIVLPLVEAEALPAAAAPSERSLGANVV